jgi:anti-anti-sigma factor
METIDPGAGFRITRVHEAEYLTWQVVGDLDTFRVLHLTEQIRAELTGGVAYHLVDLSEVSSVDATGVCALIRLHKQCAPRGRMVVACAPGDPPWQVLTATGAGRILHLAEDPDSAAEQLRQDRRVLSCC